MQTISNYLEGTDVLTDKGFVPIKDIKMADSVAYVDHNHLINWTYVEETKAARRTVWYRLYNSFLDTVVSSGYLISAERVGRNNKTSLPIFKMRRNPYDYFVPSFFTANPNTKKSLSTKLSHSDKLALMLLFFGVEPKEYHPGFLVYHFDLFKGRGDPDIMEIYKNSSDLVKSVTIERSKDGPKYRFEVERVVLENVLNNLNLVKYKKWLREALSFVVCRCRRDLFRNDLGEDPKYTIQSVITTSYKELLDWVQAVLTLIGDDSVMTKERIDGIDVYTLYRNQNQNGRSTMGVEFLNDIKVKKEKGHSTTYQITIPVDGCLITRYQGKIGVIGYNQRLGG